jgi:outer membrane biosynthesis protein TonB
MKLHRIVLSRPFNRAVGLAAIFLFGALAARGQDQFFHRGAQHFLVGSNALAKAEVERGLQMHPDDPSLKKFWELLNQQQQQQQNQDDKQQDEQQKDQQKQDQQKKDQQQSKDDKGKQSQEKDKEKESQKKEQEQQQKEQEQKEQQQQQSAANKDQEKKEEEKKGQGQPQNADQEEGNPGDPSQAMKAVRMTPQQAVQLLEAMKAEEKTLQFRPILRTNRTERMRKDW